jgi:hypothetical protein
MRAVKRIKSSSDQISQVPAHRPFGKKEKVLKRFSCPFRTFSLASQKVKRLGFALLESEGSFGLIHAE